MKTILLLVMLIGVILIIGNQGFATTVNYDLANLSGNQWEYTYTVVNDSLGADIEEFTVYFAYGLYNNLMVTSPLADWNELTVNPDIILGYPFDGLYDALALVSGIVPGSSMSGFSVSFDWLGAATPASQYFEVVDPLTFEAIDFGNTTASVAKVPEPATLILFGSAILGFAGFRKALKKWLS